MAITPDDSMKWYQHLEGVAYLKCDCGYRWRFRGASLLHIKDTFNNDM